MSIIEPFRAAARNEPDPKISPFRKAPALPPGNSFVRLLTANVLAQIYKTTPAEIAAERWPDDRIVERAAAAPAMTSVTGWAAELATRLVADGIAALGPYSAGAELLGRGLVLNWTGAGSVSAPGFSAGANSATWVAEGEPIPVEQLPITPGIIAPHKIASIAVLTREMIEGSNAEALIADALMGAAGLALDAVLFDANAETAARPQGLRNGIAALTASNNADMAEAYIEDVRALLNAVGTVGGSGPYAFIAGFGRGTIIDARVAPRGDNFIILGTPAMGNDVMAVALRGIATAFDPQPEVISSKAASIHMDDSAPQQMGTYGPQRSMFQTDSVALKMRWPISWVRRSAQAVAWMTPTWK